MATASSRLQQTHNIKPGKITGKGTGMSDSISAKLPTETFVIPANVLKAFGNAFFDKLEEEAGEAKGMAGGGIVPPQYQQDYNDANQSWAKPGSNPFEGSHPIDYLQSVGDRAFKALGTNANNRSAAISKGLQAPNQTALNTIGGSVEPASKGIENLAQGNYQMPSLISTAQAGYAKGGKVDAKVSNGERLMSKAAVTKFGPEFFNRLIASVQGHGAEENGEGKIHAAGGALIKDPFLDNQPAPVDKYLAGYKGMPVVPAIGKAMSDLAGAEVQGAKGVKNFVTTPNEGYKNLLYGEGNPTAFQSMIGTGQQPPTAQPAQGLPQIKPAITPVTQPNPTITPTVQPAKEGEFIPRGTPSANRVDLGEGNYIGDNKPRSQESVARMKGLMTPSTDAQLADRAASAKMADDRYVQANRNAQNGQQNNNANQIQPTYQQPDYSGEIQDLMAQIPRGSRSDSLGTMIANKGQRKDIDQKLATLQGLQQSSAQQGMADRRLQAEGNQFNLGLMANREIAKNALDAGRLKAQAESQWHLGENKIKQQEANTEQAKVDQDKFTGVSGGIDLMTGAQLPLQMYNRKTGLPPQQQQQQAQQQASDDANSEGAYNLSKNPALATDKAHLEQVKLWQQTPAYKKWLAKNYPQK